MGRRPEAVAHHRENILVLAGAALCLSFPPGIKEGSPVPGVLCDFGVLSAAVEAEPESLE